MLERLNTLFDVEGTLLGPINSELFEDIVVFEKVFEQDNRIFSNLRNNVSFILGRKGSGKTSLIKSFNFRYKKNHIIKELPTSEILSDMANNLRKKENETILLDSVTHFWDKIFWVEVFQVINPKEDEKLKTLLSPFIFDKRNLNSKTVLKSLIQNIAKRENNTLGGVMETLDNLFVDSDYQRTKAEIKKYLQHNKLKIHFLLDSIEDVEALSELESLSMPLSSLFHLIGKKTFNEFYTIHCALPTEYWYHTLKKQSLAPYKDFSEMVLLQWNAKEISSILEHRYSIAKEVYGKKGISLLDNLYDYIEDEIENGLKTKETVKGYIFRHTHLLPRQLIKIFNEIFYFHYRRYQDDWATKRIDNQDIIRAIKKCEVKSAIEIFREYSFVYPNLQERLKKVLINLPLVFNNAELHKAFNRYGKKSKETGVDYNDFKRSIIEICAVGKVIDETDKYYVGIFEYHLPDNLLLSEKDVMCKHPIFGEYFSTNRVAGNKPIYPYGVFESEEDYRDRFF